MSREKIGKVALTPKGEYNSSSQYEPLDVMTHSGKAYVVLSDVKGVTPSNDGVNYQLLVSDGYTPKKGTDYWTDADVASVVQDVSEQSKAIVDEAAEAKKNSVLGSIPDDYTTLSEKANNANNIFANALKGNVIGQGVNITDVSPIEHKIDIKVKNKNVLPYPYFETTKTVDDITFTDNGDGTITVNGTNTGTAITKFVLHQASEGTLKLEKGKTYTISGIPKGASVSGYRAVLQTGSGQQSTNLLGNTTLTIQYEDPYMLQILIAAGTTVDNLTFAIQIEEGSNATEYVPYVNPSTVHIEVVDANNIYSELQLNQDNMASITSTYPSMDIRANDKNAFVEVVYNKDINTVVKKILSENKTINDNTEQIVAEKVNLFDRNNLVDGYYKGNGVDYFSGGQRIEYYIPIKTGVTYSWTPDLRIMINTYDENKTGIERLLNYTTESPNYTDYNSCIFNEDVKFVRLSSTGNFPDDFMFVEGDKCPTVFEKYGEINLKTEAIKPWKSIFSNVKCAWFGDSISQLKLLPHRVGDMIQIDVADCSFAGASLTHSNNEYLEYLSFIELTKSIVSGDFTAQDEAIEGLKAANGITGKNHIENLTHLRNLDFNNVDMVVVLAGTNDFGQNVSETDFKAGFAEAIERLLTAFPHLLIYVISPLWRGNADTSNNSNPLSQYVEWEKTVCETYNIPFLDLYHSCNINSLTMSKWLIDDNLHQTVDGDTMIAKKCAKFLMSN